MSLATTTEIETRISEQGSKIAVGDLRRYLEAALSHEAVAEDTHSLTYQAAARGYHPDVVAQSLRPIIEEMLETATYEDWLAIAEGLIGQAREARAEH